MALVDTKLAQITTSGKVAGSALVITGLTTVTAVGSDFMYISDTSDSANPKKALLSDVTFTPSASNALSGSVIKVVNTQLQTPASGTTVVPFDNSKIQIGEGDPYLSRAITPSNASNLLKITVVLQITCSTGSAHGGVGLFQDAGSDSLCSTAIFASEAATPTTTSFVYYMTAGTTSATTFTVRAGYTTGTCYVNQGSSTLFNGTLVSSITIEEIKA